MVKIVKGRQKKKISPGKFFSKAVLMWNIFIEKRNPRQDVAAKRHPLNGIAVLRMATAALCEAFRRQGGLPEGRRSSGNPAPFRHYS
jgi:hypothetical protein